MVKISSLEFFLSFDNACGEQNIKKKKLNILVKEKMVLKTK